MTDPQSVVIRVLFFAKAREIVGRSETRLEVPSRIIAEKLLNILCENYSLNIIKANLILAVNENYCEEGKAALKLKDGDEVALIPPISGG